MDAFTEELLALAYETIKTRKRRRDPEPTVKALLEQAWRHWLTYREGVIATWATQIHARVPFERLAYLLEPVDHELPSPGGWTGCQLHEAWELPEEGQEPEWVAWGLACLRWFNRERAGRVPTVNCTEEEAANWLTAQNGPSQMRLFD